MEDKKLDVEVIPVCDPHFHLWCLEERANANLGKEVEDNLPSYLISDYLKAPQLYHCVIFFFLQRASIGRIFQSKAFT